MSLPPTSRDAFADLRLDLIIELAEEELVFPGGHTDDGELSVAEVGEVELVVVVAEDCVVEAIVTGAALFLDCREECLQGLPVCPTKGEWIPRS